MINKSKMDLLDSLGFGADIDALEDYVETLQDAAGMGEPIVTNEVYDTHIKLLKELKPESILLSRNWEVDDNELTNYDDILKVTGMKSINTIQDFNDLRYFVNKMEDSVYDMIASVKYDGHAIRTVYKYGELITASTRGRSKKGRDITRHAKSMLPNYIDSWKDFELVEVRSEALVSLNDFKSLNHIRKTALSSVTSLIRNSVTDDELKKLSAITYKCFIYNNGKVMNPCSTLENEFLYLKKLGFNIPVYKVFNDVMATNFKDTIDSILEYFTYLSNSNSIGYDSDGVVVAVNDTNEFYNLGVNGNNQLGNFALKMGKWESKIYASKIIKVIFKDGKKYKTPKAIIEPVKATTGQSISNVPLYNIGVMSDLNLVPGSTIYFKFGGETGVTLVRSDGSSVSG